MRDVTAELKELRLQGMVSAWTDLIAQGPMSVDSSANAALLNAIKVIPANVANDFFIVDLF